MRENNASVMLFEWRWPDRIGLTDAEPMRGLTLVQGGRRFFAPHINEAWDKVPLYGVMLAYRDGLVPAKFVAGFLAMAVLSMCYLAQRRPRGVRSALRGLHKSYMAKDSTAEKLLGKQAAAWKKLYPNNRTKSYSPAMTRNRLGRFLASYSEPAKPVTLPTGILPLFDLKPPAPDFVDQLYPIYTRVAEWLESRGAMTRKARFLQRWMNDRIAHCSKPPLCTDRRMLLWATAHATYISWAGFHAYIMHNLMLQIDPPLDQAERLQFRFFHTSTKYLGVPFWRMPQPYLQLIACVTGDLLAGKKSLQAAQDEVATIWQLHSAIVDDTKESDKATKKSIGDKQRRDAATRDRRGRERRSKRKSE